MTDIPDDIMRTAREIVGRIEKVHIWKGDAVVDVAKAILAERERCAQIAETFTPVCGHCVQAIRQTRQETE